MKMGEFKDNVEDSLKKLFGDSYYKMVQVQEHGEYGLVNVRIHTFCSVSFYPNKFDSSFMGTIENKMLNCMTPMLFLPAGYAVNFLFDSQFVASPGEKPKHIALRLTSKTFGRHAYFCYTNRPGDSDYCVEDSDDAEVIWKSLKAIQPTHVLENKVIRPGTYFRAPILLEDGRIILPTPSQDGTNLLGTHDQASGKIQYVITNQYSEYQVLDRKRIVKLDSVSPQWMDEYITKQVNEVNPSLSKQLQDILDSCAVPDMPYRGCQVSVTRSGIVWFKIGEEWISLGSRVVDIKHSLNVVSKEAYDEYLMYESTK